MAISVNSIWEIRTSADAGNVGGGFFVEGASGSDFSQQNSPQYALTGVTSAGAGNTILTASAAADMVGNGIKVISGTNFTVSWFEITSVSVGVSITCSTNAAGTAISIGVGASGVMNVGGAISLGTSGASGDDDVFEASAVGNTFYVKLGTYTIGETVSIILSGAGANPIKVYGYQTTRGDNPTGANRPTFALGANLFASGAGWYWKNLILTGTGTNVFNISSGEILVVNIKATNTSTSISRNAFIGTGGDSMAFNCEAISYRGNGFSTSGRMSIMGCYIHDSSIGILDTGTVIATFIYNIIESCVTAAIRFSGVKSNLSIVENNTLYGSENTTGIGIDITAAGAVNFRTINNIIYGFATGVSHVDANTEGFDDYNDYFNNDNDVNAAANWQKGSKDVAINPSFTGVAQLTGTTATTSGSVLTQSDGDFSTVVDGRDFLYLVSGTGITAGIYGITAHTSTTITLDIAPGTDATADKVWQITTGRNFAITGAI